MTDASMVERVARAIATMIAGKMAVRRAGETLTVAMMCGYAWEGDAGHIDKFVNDNWRRFEQEARAAIEAMKNPTGAMRGAGADAVDDGETYGCGWKANAAYHAMIDAALKE